MSIEVVILGGQPGQSHIGVCPLPGSVLFGAFLHERTTHTEQPKNSTVSKESMKRFLLLLNRLFPLMGMN